MTHKKSPYALILLSPKKMCCKHVTPSPLVMIVVSLTVAYLQAQLLPYCYYFLACIDLLCFTIISFDRTICTQEQQWASTWQHKQAGVTSSPAGSVATLLYLLWTMALYYLVVPTFFVGEGHGASFGVVNNPADSKWFWASSSALFIMLIFLMGRKVWLPRQLICSWGLAERNHD